MKVFVFFQMGHTLWIVKTLNLNVKGIFVKSWCSSVSMEAKLCGIVVCVNILPFSTRCKTEFCTICHIFNLDLHILASMGEAYFRFGRITDLYCKIPVFLCKCGFFGMEKMR